MSLHVTITIDNQLGKSVEDPTFTLRALPPPTLTSGSVISQPQDVPNESSSSHNGGIYSNVLPGTVRGIIFYALPTNRSHLVIFFDKELCLIMIVEGTVPSPTTSESVDTAERDGKLYVKGNFIVGNESFDYQARCSLVYSFIITILTCKR